MVSFKTWHFRQSVPRRWRDILRAHKQPPSNIDNALAPNNHEDYEPSSKDYPVFPPLPPLAILRAPAEYWATISARKFAAPRGIFEDSSLFALYRFYELIILDEVLDYRNALEAFWRQEQWSVSAISDPKDIDHTRYAFLAGCTYLLAKSFNQRVQLGLQRSMPSLLTPEEAENARQIPHHLRQYESIPIWAARVTTLPATLAIPTHDGVVLNSMSDKRADPDFVSKNILLWTPHIYFT